MTLFPFLLIVLLPVCYLIGSVPFGYLIGKSRGIDIRKYGSGNIGATNVRRVLGKQAGVLCFVLDFLKGLVPVLVLVTLQKVGAIDDSMLIPVVAALGVVAGHVWTLFLGFKGGKGIATSAGALFALAPGPVFIAAFVWLVFFLPTRIVSVASLAAAAALPTSGIVLRVIGFETPSASVLALLLVLAVLAVLRHRSNIRRLLDGTESRFHQGERESYATVSMSNSTDVPAPVSVEDSPPDQGGE